MKIKAVSYKHSSDMSIELIAEGGVEQAFLSNLWRHGELAGPRTEDNPNGPIGFMISVKPEQKQDKPKDI